MGSERLDQDEVALVLRRAAELDVSDAPAGDERLPVEAVEAAAAEVGVPPAAVRQAVAELRAGLLSPDLDATACPPNVVIEAAVLPLEPEAAMDELGRWLSSQTFHRHRGRDGVEVWRVREDWIAGMQRAFDWAASVRLKDVREVVVQAVVVEGGTLVRLQATISGATAVAPGVGTGVGTGAGLLAGVMVAGAAGIDAAVAMATVTAGAGAGAAGGWSVGRRFRRRRADTVADELAAELDRLASGLTAERTAIDRLRSRARRYRGPWA